MLTSVILGLFSISTLFALSVLIVVGIKFLYLKIEELLNKTSPPKNSFVQVENPPRKKRRLKNLNKPKTIKSIEIDPNEIDRIYVKKVS